nr:nucleoporin NUP42-like [Lytechinus pictus]
MPVCRYFQQGNCRFGDRCRYEHPRNQSGFGNQGSFRGGGGGGGGGGSQSQYKWSSSNYGTQQHYGSQQQRGPGSRDLFSGGGAGGGGGDGSWGNRGSHGQGGYQGGGRGSWAGGGSNRDGGFRGGEGGGGKQVNFKDSFNTFQGNKFGTLADQGSRDDRSNQAHGNTQDVPAQEIMDGILYDMEEWESGKMWPFSCYGPNKSKSCLAGLEDLSQEELRFLAYTAEKAKQFDQYRAACTTAMDAVKNKRNQLKKPSQSMKNQLVDMYKGASDKNPFAEANPTNIFGNSVPSLTDIFGANLANIKVASDSSTSTGTMFGKQPPTGSSLLGVPPGSAESAPAAPSSSSLFNRTQGPTQPVFGGAVGKSDTPAPAFGSASSSSASSASSVFGSGSQTSVGSGTGLFGKGPSTPAVDPQQQKAESRTYTPMASLTPEEKEQFEAPIFTLGKVPTRPPPIELVR